jgi:hypothetical protein
LLRLELCTGKAGNEVGARVDEREREIFGELIFLFIIFFFFFFLFLFYVLSDLLFEYFVLTPRFDIEGFFASRHSCAPSALRTERNIAEELSTYSFRSFTSSLSSLQPSVMMFVMSTAVALASASLLSIAYAQSCSTTLTPGNNVKPSLASGYEMALVATGLTKPRSLQFDNAGNLLVVEQSNGVSSHAIQDDGGLCLSFKSSNMVIQNKGVS